MKKKNRFLSWMMSFVMAVTMFPALYAEGQAAGTYDSYVDGQDVQLTATMSYSITVDENVAVQSNAFNGDTVTLEVPDTMVDDSLVVSYVNTSNKVAWVTLTKESDTKYSFVMPEADVQVSCLVNNEDNQMIVVGTTDSYYARADKDLTVTYDVPLPPEGYVYDIAEVYVPVRAHDYNDKGTMSASMNGASYAVNKGVVSGKTSASGIKMAVPNSLIIKNPYESGVDYYYNAVGYYPVTANHLATLTLTLVEGTIPEREQLPGQILRYNFRNIQEDGTVEDVSGNGNDGSVGVVNTVEYQGNKGIATDADDTYVTMPDHITDDLNDYTFSMWSSVQNRGSAIHNKKLYGFGANSYLVAQGNQNYQYHSYFAQGDKNHVYQKDLQGSNGNTTWKHILVTQKDNQVSLYVNGELWDIFETDTRLSDFTTTGNYIGKELANNICDVKLYDRALTYTQILYDGASVFLNDIDGANYIMDALIPEKTIGLTEDLLLPVATIETDGYTITWETSDASVITKDGVITRPEEGKADAVLTATITFGEATLTKEIPILVDGYDVYDYTLDIKGEKGVDIQDGMYGLFYEDINYSGDGGLYAELIENRSFEAMECKSTGSKTFSAIWDGLYQWSSDDTMVLKEEGGLNENNPHYLSFQGTSFSNGAYEGVYLEKGKKYNVSFWAKSDSFDGSIEVSVGSNSVTVTDSLTNRWEKYSAVLTASEDTRYERFVITLSNPGQVDFDMISMIPDDALFGALRKDLAEKLKDLKPGFLRFPGGCIVEGNTLDSRYEWKKSVGPVEERAQNWNRWAVKSSTSLPDNGYSHYNQTLGLGFYEYFELCEYLDCEPLPVVNVGLACQYDTDISVESFPLDSEGFQQCIQDAIDLIDFANSMDFEHNEWAALRKSMGHEKPFNLTMIGIGNEQWETSTSQFFARYEAFEEAIHAAYPDIKLIGSCGPTVQSSTWTNAWNWVRGKSETNDNFVYAMDEHYYMNPDWFYQNTDFYDNYDRNVKVFAGEYASRWSGGANKPQINNLESALSIAAFMTGLERNADVVYLASYAPLFARINYTQWSPDMIWFDDTGSYGTPEYYVQKMFATNMGDYTVKSELATEGFEMKAYQTVSYDEETRELIIKLVNSNTIAETVNVVLDKKYGVTEGTKAAVSMMTSEELSDYNTIAEPEKVSPSDSEVEVSSGFRYEMPANSVTVMRISTASVSKGDVNRDGKVTAVDALKILLDAASVDKDISDVNGDGTVDSKDAAQILDYATGK
ncbi:MAG: alpha-L-arabinofuranosidase C-terminal domain-containing protein [Lachnospiraceae bacterium]